VVFVCREACNNFKELCKKKHGDGLWMEELAAMEACPPSELSFLGTSGIVLANEISALNQNVMLNLANNGVSTGDSVPKGSSDASRSDSTAGSKKGIVYSFLAHSFLHHALSRSIIYFGLFMIDYSNRSRDTFNSSHISVVFSIVVNLLLLAV